MCPNQNLSALILTDHEPVKAFLKEMFAEQGLEISFCRSWEDALTELRSTEYTLFVADAASQLDEEMHQSILEESGKHHTKTILILSQKELMNLSAVSDLSTHQYYSKGLRPKMLWLIINSLIKNDVDERDNRAGKTLVA